MSYARRSPWTNQEESTQLNAMKLKRKFIEWFFQDYIYRMSSPIRLGQGANQ